MIVSTCEIGWLDGHHDNLWRLWDLVNDTDFNTYVYDKDTIGRVYLHDNIKRHRNIQRRSGVPPRVAPKRNRIVPAQVPTQAVDGTTKHETDQPPSTAEHEYHASGIPIIEVEWT